MRGIGALAIVVSLMPLGRIAAQEVERAEAPIIERIIVRTHNVFDSTEAAGNFLFRLANGLHYTTRPSVVRHELLFKQGERYDSARVAESARNLRARGLFREVVISTAPSDSGMVDVLVDTYDGWSTQLIMNASFTAGELSWALGARETNFLGTGASVGAVYRDVPDRTALQLNANVERIRGSRFGVGGYWDNLSDGDFGAWSVGMPFRALQDRTAFTLIGQAGVQRLLQFRDGDSSRTYRRRLFLQRADVVYAPVAGPGGYIRVGVAAQVKREEFLPYELDASLVPDSVSGVVGVFGELLEPHFRVVRYYSGFGRNEDIDLSTRIVASGWLAPGSWGHPETGIGPSLLLQTGFAVGKNFVRFVGAGNGLFTGAGLDSGQVRVSLTGASQVIPKGATVVHAEWRRRAGTPPGFEYDFGHGQGPRLFGPHAFTGQHALWLAAEHRAFLFDDVFGVLGLGFAGFVDYGGAWYHDQDRRLGGNVGFGLRFGSTRSSGQNIGRFDVGYRFGEGWGDKRWAVAFGSGFAF
jgi:hypothetical protein